MCQMYEFIVPQNIKTHLTVREFLKTQGISLTEWRKIKNKGQIIINGNKQKDLKFLHAGDLLRVEMPVTENLNISPEKYALKILYEDQDLLAVSKPSGVLVHPTVSIQKGTLANYVMNYYQEIGCLAAYHPISRLDKDTSGIVLLAKNPRMQHLLALAPQQMCKKYLLLTPKPPFHRQIMVQEPIARKVGSIIEREVNREQGKPAQTIFKILAKYHNYYLLEAQLFTGRTHQIRVHASFLGIPLLGDDLYGGSKLQFSRQALHAYYLEFEQPISRKQIIIRDFLPQDMLSVITTEKLRKNV